VRRRTFWPFAGLFAVLFVVAPCYQAYAVVPAVVGPVQALVAILPQLMALLLAAIVAMFKPETYKAFLKFLWNNKILTLCFTGAVAAAIWYGPMLFGGQVAEEQSGAPWMHMRGDLARSGAVPGARGPMLGAKVMWRYAGKKREQVDSSPAVVGNRIYATSAVLNLFGGKYSGSGTLYCRDTDGGGVVWSFSGHKKMGRNLASIFSSPALGGEYPLPKDAKGEDGKPPEAEQGRYLVCGEGYHIDINSRLFCLDLLPLKSGEKEPKLVWFKQGTSHFESSPAIIKCVDGKWRTYMGGGDDGIWAVELESGKISWMIEGTRSYYVRVDCKKIEQIKALDGKSVKVNCVVERFGATAEDPGQVVITEIIGFEEIAQLSRVTTDAGDKGFRRTVVGTVRVGNVPTVQGSTPGSRKLLKESSAVRIDIQRYYADVESAPAAVNLPVDPKDPKSEQQTLVFIGNGLPLKDFDAKGKEVPRKRSGGKRVQGGSGLVCLDGVTGDERWFHETPNPLFSAPTVVRNVTLKNEKGEDLKTTDVVIAGYGEGDFVNLAKGDGFLVCLDIHDAPDGKPKVLWKVETGATILGATAVRDGQAYACSADGKLYVVDISTGKLIKAIPLGVCLVCGPIVTHEAVYVVSKFGMAYCIDRKSFEVRWKLSLMPCSMMFSSPVLAGGKIYVGTPGQGLYCLTEGTSDYVRPWSGAGGTTDRGGTADNLGLPSVEGATAPRKWKDYALIERVQDGEEERIVSRTVPGPLAACGGLLYTPAKGTGAEAEKVFLACIEARADNGVERWLADIGGAATAIAARKGRVYALAGKGERDQNLFCLDAKTGKKVWNTGALYMRDVLCLAGNRVLVSKGGKLLALDAETGAAVKDWRSKLEDVTTEPVAAHAMILAATGGEKPRMVCLEDGSGRELWSTPLPGKPVGPVTCKGDRVAVACEVKNGKDTEGVLVVNSLIDGKRLLKIVLPALPVGHPVLSEEYYAVATSNGRVYAYDTKGKLVREDGMPVGGPAQSPALVGGILLYAGKKKLATWNLTAGNWPWNYQGQKVMGQALAPPVVMGETVYLCSEKRGLIAVGVQPVVALVMSLKEVRVKKDLAWTLAAKFATVAELRKASAADLRKALPADAELADAIHRELHQDDQKEKAQ
jgi:outer membrane protein assembly factor BamB